jgi:hypothetical protein
MQFTCKRLLLGQRRSGPEITFLNPIREPGNNPVCRWHTRLGGRRFSPGNADALPLVERKNPSTTHLVDRRTERGKGHSVPPGQHPHRRQHVIIGSVNVTLDESGNLPVQQSHALLPRQDESVGLVL